MVDSSNNMLSGNIFSNNFFYGIVLSYSRNNLIIGNNVSNPNNLGTPNFGISLDSSSNNTIYDNYFNYMINAQDNGNNIWNTTKTLGTNIIGGPYLGGNYWSDYSGSDLNGDGLGDTLVPYDSSGNIANGGDYLPLTEPGPSIKIYTDKSAYKAGNRMHVGLNVSNPGESTNVGMYIWIDLPSGGKKMVASYPSITLPAGLDYKKYPWMSVTLPNIPAGNYAWHAVLKNTTSGNIISESISPWIFIKTVQITAGSNAEIGTMLQEESEIDFGNDFHH